MDMKTRARESKAVQNLLKSLRRRRAREHNVKNYLASVERFCKFTKKTPDQLIAEAENISETLQNFVDNMIDQKLAPKTIRANYYNLQKFFSANKIKIEAKSVELPPAKNVYEDRAIRKDEIKLLLKTGDFRQRVLVLLPAASGVRLGSLPYLKLEHLEKWEDPSTTTPVALNIPSEAAKGYTAYTTFISPECYESIQDYLNYRRKFGENITSETCLIRDTFEAKPNGAVNPKPLAYNGLKTLFHRMINRYLRKEKKRRHEFKTTHGFRKFFRTCLDNAGVPAGAAAALMGHSAGLISIYTRHTLEQLRSHYSKAVPDLTIEKLVVESEIERRKQTIRDMARMLPDMTPEKRMLLENLLTQAKTDEQVERVFSKLSTALSKEKEKTEQNGGTECDEKNCQKIVEEQELQEWLNKSWKVVSVLPSGKVVIEN